MILQELATNAVKYGALSMPGGQVKVRWELEEGEGRRLHLRWQEQGGPQVQPPTYRGFGMRLVEFAAARELGGRAELTFASEGLVAEIILSLV